MVAATFLDFFWSLLIIFFMVIFFVMLFYVIADIFSRDDASGWKKTIWIIFIIVLPFIGLLAYLIVNADDMARRRMKEAQQAQQQFDQYVQSVAAGSADQIAKAKELLDNGTITQAEFDAIKAKALA